MDDPNGEPVDAMARATLVLARESLERVTGLVGRTRRVPVETALRGVP